MESRPQPRRRRRCLTGLVLKLFLVSALCLGIVAASAKAAFPGQNGKITFARNVPGFGYNVYAMSPDGSGQTLLAVSKKGPGDPALGGDPVFSPDGREIVFVSDRDGNFELYGMNADGTCQTRLTDHPLTDDDPAFSPDGSKLAFVYSDDIYVMNADGSGTPVRLTTNTATDANPVFSPDGTKIAFESFRDGNMEIYVMNAADGSAQTNLTNSATSYDQQPDFSPDGRKIVFSKGSSAAPLTGTFSLYVMNANGSGSAPLTSGAVDLEPAFSPDGTKVIFATGAPPFQIVQVNTNGSGRAPVTNGVNGNDVFPNWGPVRTSATPAISCGSAPPNGDGSGGAPPSGAPTGGSPNNATGATQGTPVNTPTQALTSEARRASGLRTCLAAVARHARRERRLARGGSARARARARRHMKQHAAAGRRRCLRLYGSTPGRVTGLVAQTVANRQIQLTFDAPGTDGSRPPAARAYLIKQSFRPIHGTKDRRAQTLCRGSCRFSVTRVGTKLRFTVTDLRPHTRYYYTVAARDNISARAGPPSQQVSASTP